MYFVLQNTISPVVLSFFHFSAADLLQPVSTTSCGGGGQDQFPRVTKVDMPAECVSAQPLVILKWGAFDNTGLQLGDSCQPTTESAGMWTFLQVNRVLF